MNSRDRRLLQSGINPLTGQPLSPTLAPAGPPRVANATSAVPWAPAPAAPAAPVAPVAPQPWLFTGEHEDKYGEPHAVLYTIGRNGDRQRWVIRLSLLLAVQNGTVQGPDGKPTRLS